MGPLAGLLRAVRDNSLGLLIGAGMGLTWANVAGPRYESFAHPLHFVVNDLGMVFFSSLAAKEIVEATLPGGALASPRRAAVPLLAAAGGMAGPAVMLAQTRMGALFSVSSAGLAVTAAIIFRVGRFARGPA